MTGLLNSILAAIIYGKKTPTKLQNTQAAIGKKLQVAGFRHVKISGSTADVFL